MAILSKLISIFPIILYPFLNIIVLFILGFGLTHLILPKSLRVFWLWLSPWITIITAIFYFVVLNLIGFSLKQTFIPYIIICICAGLYVLIKMKPIINIKKGDLVLTALVGLTLVLNLMPLIKRDKILTSVSMGNNDIIAYAATSDYLKNHSIKESFKTTTDTAVGTLLQNGYRWGPPAINSFFLTLLNLQGYQYTYIAQVVLYSLMIPLVYIFFQILFGKSNMMGLIIVSVFTGFNANLLYMIYHDFFGQVLFWGIEVLLFIFFYSYFGSQEIKYNKPNTYDFILGILITVLYFSYHEPAIFLFTPIAVFMFICLILKKTYFKNYFFALLKIAFISLITGATSIFNAFIVDYKQIFIVNSNDPIGWQLFRSKIPYANPFEAMGFWSIHNFDPMPTILAIVLSIFVMLIIIKGVLKSKYKILTICYLLFFFLVYYLFGIYKQNFFAYNRALTYTLPFIIVLFSIGITSLYQKKKFFWSLIIIILIGLELWSAVKLNKRFINEQFSIEKSYISILDLKGINIKEPIYAESYIEDTTPLWKQIWTAYFLYSKGISVTPTIFNSDQFENKVPDNGLVLISRSTPWLTSRKIIFNDIIWNNEYYQLGHICNSDECLMKSPHRLYDIKIGKNEFEDSLLINGWNITEGDTRWANEKESTLRLVTKDVYLTKLTIEALSLSKPQEITVYIDDIMIGKTSIDTVWGRYSLPIDSLINPGVHRLKFTYSNGYRPMDVVPGSLDNRVLYVNFKEIKLE